MAALLLLSLHAAALLYPPPLRVRSTSIAMVATSPSSSDARVRVQLPASLELLEKLRQRVAADADGAMPSSAPRKLRQLLATRRALANDASTHARAMHTLSSSHARLAAPFSVTQWCHERSIVNAEKNRIGVLPHFSFD
ncbi:hypothetical protein AB1Y20_019692 [Prymnesium parvum]|uniref:Uncharacterized protein n=1 Tax=Prymnesium parvum TaxID=97485 RepID=A0AB34JUS0_PRYPA